MKVKSLNVEISQLKNQISKIKTTCSDLEKEKKKLKTNFSRRENEFVDEIINQQEKSKSWKICL